MKGELKKFSRAFLSTFVCSVSLTLMLTSCKTRTFGDSRIRSDLNLANDMEAELEGVIAKHGLRSSDDFLANEPARKEYLEVWQRNYGWAKKIDERLNNVVMGLQEASQHRKDSSFLLESLWRVDPEETPTKLEFFSDQLLRSNTLSEEVLEKILSFESSHCIKNDVARESSDSLQNQNREATQNSVTLLRSKISALEQGLLLGTSKERRVAQATLYKTLKSDPLAVSIARTALCRSLQDGGFFQNQAFPVLSPSAIATLWHQSAEQWAQSNNLSFSRIDAVIASESPKMDTRTSVSGQTESVAPEYKLTLFRIRRPFHSIFKGAILGECVGGECSRVLSVERWASGALPGAATYFGFLRRKGDSKGSHVGFVQATPLRISSAPERKFYGLDFGIRELSLQGAWMNSEKTIGVGHLFEHLVWTWKQNKPDVDFLKSDSNAINNAGISRLVLKSKMYLESKQSFSSAVAHHSDAQFAKGIVNLRRTHGLGKGVYGGKMITDATVSDAVNLQVLDTSALPTAPWAGPGIGFANLQKSYLKNSTHSIPLPDVTVEECSRSLNMHFQQRIDSKLFLSCAFKVVASPFSSKTERDRAFVVLHQNFLKELTTWPKTVEHEVLLSDLLKKMLTFVDAKFHATAALDPALTAVLNGMILLGDNESQDELSLLLLRHFQPEYPNKPLTTNKLLKSKLAFAEMRFRDREQVLAELRQ
jgi:hypothetical protein